MLFRIPHIFHSVTPLRRFCIRSKVQPVSPQLNRLVEHFRRSPEVPSEGLSPRLTDFTNVRPVFPHSLLPSTGLTKRRLNHPEAIHLIPERRKTGKQGLAYNATCSFFAAYCCAVHPAVRSSSPDSAAGFPANRGAPPLWTSLCSGPPHPSLRSHARRSTEMPTCPLCERRPTLEFFQLYKDGPRCRRIVEGFERTLAATIFFGPEQKPSASVTSTVSSTNPI